MEFFAETATPMRAEVLQREVRVDSLDRWSASIDKVLSHEGSRGELYTVWGQFRVHREVLRDGLRFSLPACPNALQWTLTVDAASGAGPVVVHCTINRASHDADFIASIEQFVDDWRQGLECGAGRTMSPRASGECSPWYG